MKRAEMIEWMVDWCSRNGAMLQLAGSCGLGRPCVGVIVEDNYPSYQWDDDDGNREDANGDVWCPADAYHKHPCVAVLGRGDKAEVQLYEWLKWFDEHGFTIETGDRKVSDPIQVLMGLNVYVHLVRPKDKTDG